METILETILAEKKKEVEMLKESQVRKAPVARNRNSLLEKLENAKELMIIGEFKRASPSKGDININSNPASQVQMYVDAGADAVSVLTDTTFFKGSMDDLQVVRQLIANPILCKDFIIDPIQIDVAKNSGADIVLLIAAALDDRKLYNLYQYALEKGLDVLMEVHNEAEAERVLKTDNRLIGVNNRDLRTFEVNLDVTEYLAPFIRKEERFLISESGIGTIEDVERVVAAGANGILVGETFMKHQNPSEIIKAMKLPLSEGFRR
ncbi:indole-3-glycerol phosphate synthase TrpC [Robertmurraya sp. FSL W8-0741]|uniref:indole-3-glycerol phosphate synthase TrpC n=1 Tax=Robertmurraya TaxID=2837507 RepID=UPI0010F9C5C4|nr:indole-3-glycerol phosphate synthase TrpC [Robertmurraya siralis]